MGQTELYGEPTLVPGPHIGCPVSDYSSLKNNFFSINYYLLPKNIKILKLLWFVFSQPGRNSDPVISTVLKQAQRHTERWRWDEIAVNAWMVFCLCVSALQYTVQGLLHISENTKWMCSRAANKKHTNQATSIKHSCDLERYLVSYATHSGVGPPQNKCEGLTPNSIWHQSGVNNTVSPLSPGGSFHLC